MKTKTQKIIDLGFDLIDKYKAEMEIETDNIEWDKLMAKRQGVTEFLELIINGKK